MSIIYKSKCYIHGKNFSNNYINQPRVAKNKLARNVAVINILRVDGVEL